MHDMTGRDIPVEVPKVKHYVVWNGPIHIDQFDNPVTDRDPAHYILDEKADIFRFYDRFELDWEVGGATHRLRSEPFNFSSFYVPGGKLLKGAEREAAFSGKLLWASDQKEIYYVVATRYRDAALIQQYIGDVIILQ